MRCREALRWILDVPRPDAKERGEPLRGPQGLDEHVNRCPSCRRLSEDLGIVASDLAHWEAHPAAEPELTEAASGLARRWAREAAQATRRAERHLLPARPRWSRMPRVLVGRPAMRLALAGALVAVALWFTAGGLGRGARQSFLDMAQAMDSVDFWYAKGTITPPPPTLGADTEPTVRIEVWFKKPDIIFARLGDGRMDILQVGDKRVVRDNQTGRMITEGAEAIDVTRLLNVNQWLHRDEILRAPVRDAGKEVFGDRVVRTIEVDVRGFWPITLSTRRGAGFSPLRMQFDAKTMLPVHLEAPYYSSIIQLHFDYHRPFPEDDATREFPQVNAN